MFDAIKKLFVRPLESLADCTETGAGKDDFSGIGEMDCIDTSAPWIGVDLDGTLAHWDNRSSLKRIGKPVPAMHAFVMRMVENGIRVKIFTARTRGSFPASPCPEMAG